MNNENIMGTMSEGKLLFKLSLPMILSVLVSSMYNIVDSIFVGRLGDSALTAISLSAPASSIMVAVYFGISIGVNAILSRKLGQKDADGVSRTAGNGFVAMFIAYSLFLIFGIFGVRGYYAIQTSDNDIQNLGMAYTSIVTMLSFGLMLQSLVERLLSGTGKTVGSMAVLMSGAVVNIILDPIMIFGYFGCPAMGIQGAAIATVIGQCSAGAVGLTLNLVINKDVKFKLKSFIPDLRIMREIFIIAIPAMLSYAINSILTFGMNQILIGFTTLAPAVYIIYTRVQSFIAMPVWGIRNTIVSIISYNMGARKTERVKRLITISLTASACIMAVGTLLFEMIPAPLMRIFSNSGEITALGVSAFRIIGITLILSGITTMRGGIFQAMNSSTKTLMIGIVQAASLLGSAALIAQFGNLSAVWCAFPISEIVIFILGIVFERSVNKKYLLTVKEKQKQYNGQKCLNNI